MTTAGKWIPLARNWSRVTGCLPARRSRSSVRSCWVSASAQRPDCRLILLQLVAAIGGSGSTSCASGVGEFGDAGRNSRVGAGHARGERSSDYALLPLLVALVRGVLCCRLEGGSAPSAEQPHAASVPQPAPWRLISAHCWTPTTHTPPRPIHTDQARVTARPDTSDPAPTGLVFNRCRQASIHPAPTSTTQAPGRAQSEPRPGALAIRGGTGVPRPRGVSRPDTQLPAWQSPKLRMRTCRGDATESVGARRPGGAHPSGAEPVGGSVLAAADGV